MDDQRAHLDAVYRETTYRVEAPGRSLAIRLGEPAPALDSLLAAVGLTSWAFVSAANPHSRQCFPRAMAVADGIRSEA